MAGAQMRAAAMTRARPVACERAAAESNSSSSSSSVRPATASWANGVARGSGLDCWLVAMPRVRQEPHTACCL